MDITPHCKDGNCRSCAGCQHECHPEDVRASHGAAITDHAVTEARANAVRAAAGLPPRRRYTRAA